MIDVYQVLHFFRVVFGLIFLFFVPGYAATLALFPRKDEISTVERIGYAGVLSIVADILVTLFIDLALGIPTTGINIFISLLVFTGIMLAIWRVEVLYIERKGRKDGGANAS
ncbi:MAG: DUF1616 domain-containing protein [Archaeoglobi archaeon]|nr:DUF1616 domain-containing protein [Archaeoglobi archaeon]